MTYDIAEMLLLSLDEFAARLVVQEHRLGTDDPDVRNLSAEVERQRTRLREYLDLLADVETAEREYAATLRALGDEVGAAPDVRTIVH